MQNRGQIVFDAMLTSFLLVILMVTAFSFLIYNEEKLIKESVELKKKSIAIDVLNYLTEKKLNKAESVLDEEKVRIVSDLGILDLKREMNLNETISIRIFGEVKYYQTMERCKGYCVTRGVMIEKEFGFVEVCVC